MPPIQKPGKSRQDYQTPPDFLLAVKRRLNIEEFAVDLAATPENAVADYFFTEEQDALLQSWRGFREWCWCNPPYGDIYPWVEKAWGQSDEGIGAQIAMLVPASVGSKWWELYVHQTAHVLFLHPRLTFVGCTAPYPKDCALLLYTPYINGGYETWNWK